MGSHRVGHDRSDLAAAAEYVDNRGILLLRMNLSCWLSEAPTSASDFMERSLISAPFK